MTGVTPSMKGEPDRLDVHELACARLFDEVPCFISVQDRNFRIVEANRKFKESFGEPHGRHCYEVYKKLERRCDVCPVARTFEDGGVHSSEEVVVDGAGKKTNVIVHTSPIRNASGEIESVMEVSTDITELRLLQDRLATLGQLVGGIAHSIKNVLEGLRGGVYVANLGFRDDNPADIRTGWEMVQRNVERLSGMIMDMLYCAKEREPRRLPVDLPAAAREALEVFAARANECGVALEARIEPVGAPFLGEPRDVHSLVSNLVANAVEACCSDEDEEKRHRVVVSVFRENDAAVIRVEDNGVGMDGDARRKLFSMIYSTKGSGGTGLGLLVSHKVAVEHGGTISVESAPGRGSTFTVRLPMINGNADGD
ncbi:MAG: ATP-binding protein [bacterium]